MDGSEREPGKQGTDGWGREHPADRSTDRNLIGGKQLMRREVLAGLRGLSVRERDRKSARVSACVRGQRWWKEAAVVLAYCPLDTEVDVTSLLRAALEEGKQLYLPRTGNRELSFHLVHSLESGLAPHPYGMREPVAELPAFSPARLEEYVTVAVLVPGLAFDAECFRLGRGKGYYDRSLRRLRAARDAGTGWRLTVAGVAFTEQMVDLVPRGPWDERLDLVCSEARAWYCSDGGVRGRRAGRQLDRDRGT